LITFCLANFLPQLDGRHVVFGEVVDGMDIVKAIEAQGSENGTPKATVAITASGEIDSGIDA
jgi:cyclophilin family peptidyl-prolyl cis-trans isomerase